MATTDDLMNCAHGHHEFQGRDGEQLTHCLHCGEADEAEPAADKVYVVEGEHWSTPGSPSRAFLDEGKAKAYAAELVNNLITDATTGDFCPLTETKLAADATAETWAEKLRALQVAFFVEIDGNDPDDFVDGETDEDSDVQVMVTIFPLYG